MSKWADFHNKQLETDKTTAVPENDIEKSGQTPQSSKKEADFAAKAKDIMKEFQEIPTNCF